MPVRYALLLCLVACTPDRVSPLSAGVATATARLQLPDTFLGATSSIELRVWSEARWEQQVRLHTEAPFSVELTQVTLGAGERRTVRVGFTPTAPGAATGRLELVAEGLSLAVDLQGVGLTPPDCTPTGDCRMQRFDAELGHCVLEPRPDGTPCSEPCLEDGSCREGQCVGTARSCDDGNACTLDACDARTGCMTVPLTCAEPADPCQVGACDPVRGCTTTELPDGTHCGPATCSTLSICMAGRCTAYARPPAHAADALACSLSSEGDHNCQVMRDGTVRCWGSNFLGQLGDGTTTDRLRPVTVVGLSDAVQVSAGMRATCALRAGGTVVCWGYDVCGAEPVPQCSLAAVTPVAVPGLSDVTSISAGYLHRCALRRDGTLWCWGNGEDGALGDGAAVDRPFPTQVAGLTDVVAVSAGRYQTCAVRADGSLWCWGYNLDSRLGRGAGSAVQSNVPVRVEFEAGPLTGVVDVTSGIGTCALLRTGQALCWGWAWGGMVLPGVHQMAAGDHAMCFTLQDATVRCAGLMENNLLRGYPSLEGIAQVSTGEYHACALRTDGSYRCWGYNGNGQLGDGTTQTRLEP